MKCDAMQRMKEKKDGGFDEGEMKSSRQRDKVKPEKAASEK